MNLFAPVLFHRYPGYLRSVWITYAIPWLVQNEGVLLGGRVNFSGRPIVSMVPDSSIRIGDGAFLCSLSQSTALGVAHPVILRTLFAGACIVIGRGVRMSGTTICAAKSVKIGDRVCIGANATITDTDFHSLASDDRSGEADGYKAATDPVKIEDDVFIGAGVYILKGVVIGRGAVVGAASVVTKNVQAGAIVAGNPAKVIGVVPNMLDGLSPQRSLK